jgi:hypothetical protein
MSEYSCCLCSAVLGEIRDGTIEGGIGSPLCAEHRAQLNERARQPKPPQPPRVVTLGSFSYEDASILCGGPSLSLC